MTIMNRTIYISFAIIKFSLVISMVALYIIFLMGLIILAVYIWRHDINFMLCVLVDIACLLGFSFFISLLLFMKDDDDGTGSFWG